MPAVIAGDAFFQRESHLLSRDIFGPVVGGVDHLDRLANGLLARPAKQPLGTYAPFFNDPVSVFEDDRKIGHPLHQLLEPRLAHTANVARQRGDDCSLRYNPFDGWTVLACDPQFWFRNSSS